MPQGRSTAAVRIRPRSKQKFNRHRLQFRRHAKRRLSELLEVTNVLSPHGQRRQPVRSRCASANRTGTCALPSIWSYEEHPPGADAGRARSLRACVLVEVAKEAHIFQPIRLTWLLHHVVDCHDVGEIASPTRTEAGIVIAQRQLHRLAGPRDTSGSPRECHCDCSL